MACPFSLSKDKIELQFATNHIGMFNVCMCITALTIVSTYIIGSYCFFKCTDWEDAVVILILMFLFNIILQVIFSWQIFCWTLLKKLHVNQRKKEELLMFPQRLTDLHILKESVLTKLMMNQGNM